MRVPTDVVTAFDVSASLWRICTFPQTCGIMFLQEVTQSFESEPLHSFIGMSAGDFHYQRYLYPMLITQHMIERDKLRLPCPLCQRTDTLRITAYTDVSAVAWSDGEWQIGWDYSDPELDPMTEIRCRECSVTLSLQEGNNKRWRLVPEQKPSLGHEGKKPD